VIKVFVVSTVPWKCFGEVCKVSDNNVAALRDVTGDLQILGRGREPVRDFLPEKQRARASQRPFWREKRDTVIILGRRFTKMSSCVKTSHQHGTLFDQEEGSVTSNTNN